MYLKVRQISMKLENGVTTLITIVTYFFSYCSEIVLRLAISDATDHEASLLWYLVLVQHCL
jgi:hypothetical protein